MVGVDGDPVDSVVDGGHLGSPDDESGFDDFNMHSWMKKGIL